MTDARLVDATSLVAALACGALLVARIARAPARRPAPSRRPVGPHRRAGPGAGATVRSHARTVARRGIAGRDIAGRAIAGRDIARRAVARRARALPELIDLVVIGVHAGQSPMLVLSGCASAMPADLRPTIERVLARLDGGEPTERAVQSLVDDIGPPALALAEVLRAASRTGGHLGPALDRLADDARRQRRHLAEQAARELPVRLAFPLVCCTLPSFVLVAIVPLLLGALSSLRQP